MDRIERVVARFLVGSSIIPTPNKLKGINKQVAEDPAVTEGEEKPTTDILPYEVFTPKPKNVAVLNFAETGKSMEKAIATQIPKDKGYNVVNGLSQ